MERVVAEAHELSLKVEGLAASVEDLAARMREVESRPIGSTHPMEPDEPLVIPPRPDKKLASIGFPPPAPEPEVKEESQEPEKSIEVTSPEF